LPSLTVIAAYKNCHIFAKFSGNYVDVFAKTWPDRVNIEYKFERIENDNRRKQHTTMEQNQEPDHTLQYAGNRHRICK
jgi:hypothetical protein